jgi:hypothetical protein
MSVTYMFGPYCGEQRTAQTLSGEPAKRVMSTVRPSDAFGFCQCELFYTVPPRGIVL